MPRSPVKRPSSNIDLSRVLRDVDDLPPILSSDSLFGNDQPLEIDKTVDYDLWTGPAPRRDLMRKQLHYDWHWDSVTGNGDLGNQGIHQVDQARWAIGVRIASALATFGSSPTRSICRFGGQLS